MKTRFLRENPSSNCTVIIAINTVLLCIVVLYDHAENKLSIAGTSFYKRGQKRKFPNRLFDLECSSFYILFLNKISAHWDVRQSSFVITFSTLVPLLVI